MADLRRKNFPPNLAFPEKCGWEKCGQLHLGVSNNASECDLLLEELLYIIVVVFHLMNNQSLLRIYFEIDLRTAAVIVFQVSLCLGLLCALID